MIGKLFNFHFRFEVYLPKAKRKYGCYVMPILHGDRFIGRVDPIMDREHEQLKINAVYVEPDASKSEDTARVVANTIEELGRFLGQSKYYTVDVYLRNGRVCSVEKYKTKSATDCPHFVLKRFPALKDRSFQLTWFVTCYLRCFSVIGLSSIMLSSIRTKRQLSHNPSSPVASLFSHFVHFVRSDNPLTSCVCG